MVIGRVSSAILYTLALAAVAAAAGPATALLGAIVLPILLGRRWLALARTHAWSWFLRAKIGSVLAAAAGVSLVALIGASQRVVWLTVVAFLVLNILEAVALDLANRDRVRALAGALLLVPLWWTEAAVTHGRLAASLSWTWVIAYTVWNASFVYGRWAGIVWQHAAVLSAALLVAVPLGSHAWLWARALTLGAHLVLYATFFETFRRRFETPSVYRSSVDRALSSVALALSCLATATVLAH